MCLVFQAISDEYCEEGLQIILKSRRFLILVDYPKANLQPIIILLNITRPLKVLLLLPLLDTLDILDILSYLPAGTVALSRG